MVYRELSPRYRTVLSLVCAPLVYLVVLPLTAVFHAMRYSLVPPNLPGWTFKHYLNVNLRRVVNDWTQYGLLPPRDPEEWEVPAGSWRYLRYCQVERDVVKVTSVPGFMIRSFGGLGDGDQGAEQEKADNIIQRASLEERVIYFIVGGGYVGGHPLRIHTPWSLARLTGARVFCINYRKSLSADTAFPASLLDSLAGFQYLVEELGFQPRNMMLCGDSAGANACMALARYIGDLADAAELERGWDQVGSMCLHSPWSDMTASFPSISSNRYTDHLIDMRSVRIPSHTRHFVGMLQSPYLSPALAPAGQFDHLARSGMKVYISAGTAEAFFDEIEALHDGMRRDGVDVTFRELPGATHSDFVWMDRGVAKPLGWSWKTIEQDFGTFWNATRGYEDGRTHVDHSVTTQEK